MQLDPERGRRVQFGTTETAAYDPSSVQPMSIPLPPGLTRGLLPSVALEEEMPEAFHALVDDYAEGTEDASSESQAPEVEWPSQHGTVKYVHRGTSVASLATQNWLTGNTSPVLPQSNQESVIHRPT